MTNQIDIDARLLQARENRDQRRNEFRRAVAALKDLTNKNGDVVVTNQSLSAAVGGQRGGLRSNSGMVSPAVGIALGSFALAACLGMRMASPRPQPAPSTRVAAEKKSMISTLSGAIITKGLECFSWYAMREVDRIAAEVVAAVRNNQVSRRTISSNYFTSKHRFGDRFGESDSRDIL